MNILLAHKCNVNKNVFNSIYSSKMTVCTSLLRLEGLSIHLKKARLLNFFQ